jgi:hypothetical protein
MNSSRCPEAANLVAHFGLNRTRQLPAAGRVFCRALFFDTGPHENVAAIEPALDCGARPRGLTDMLVTPKHGSGSLMSDENSGFNRSRFDLRGEHARHHLFNL